MGYFRFLIMDGSNNVEYVAEQTIDEHTDNVAERLFGQIQFVQNDGKSVEKNRECC